MIFDTLFGVLLCILGAFCLFGGFIAVPEYAEAHHGKGNAPKSTWFLRSVLVIEGFLVINLGLELLP